MRITHAIFDFDGLILDSEPLFAKCIQTILDPYGIEYTADLRNKIIGRKLHDAALCLIEETKIKMMPEEFVERMRELTKPDAGNCKLMPGVYEILNGLMERNILMCIATSSTQTFFDSKMVNYKELRKYFTHVVCGSSDLHVKRGKPYPDIFMEAMRRFDSNVKPEHVLVFEDALNGVRAAQRANTNVIWVSNDENIGCCPAGVIKLTSLLDFDFGVLE